VSNRFGGAGIDAIHHPRACLLLGSAHEVCNFGVNRRDIIEGNSLKMMKGGIVLQQKQECKISFHRRILQIF